MTTRVRELSRSSGADKQLCAIGLSGRGWRSRLRSSERRERAAEADQAGKERRPPAIPITVPATMRNDAAMDGHPGPALPATADRYAEPQLADHPTPLLEDGAPGSSCFGAFLMDRMQCCWSSPFPNDLGSESTPRPFLAEDARLFDAL